MIIHTEVSRPYSCFNGWVCLQVHGQMFQGVLNIMPWCIIVKTCIDFEMYEGIYLPCSNLHVAECYVHWYALKSEAISFYFVTKSMDTSMFLAATKQLYKWYFPSVRPSVRLSVTPFWLCSHHRIIMKFSGVITNGQSKVHAKGQGQRSKVKVTEVTTQLNRFRTVTPVWIHIWWWNDAYSLMLLRRGALLFFKVIHQISRSQGSKNRRIWPTLGVSGL